MNNLSVRTPVGPFTLPVIQDLPQKIDILDTSQPYSDECLIDANNDLQAVRSWLNQYSSKNTTFMLYKRESDRLLLWCVHEAGKTLGQLKAEDFTKYIEFLGNPPSQWCTTVGGIRTSGYGRFKWRPFLGPLGDSAKHTAIRVVNSLMNYLVDSSYLRANPLRLIKQYSKFNVNAEEYKYSVWSKILDDAEWQALQQTLQDMSESTAFEKDNKMRTQFIFACMYLLGLRVSEVAGSTWNAFKSHQEVWWFFVRGKGDKPGHIPVNQQLLSFVNIYRSYLGKSMTPTEDDTEYLIVSKRTKRPLSIKQIYSLVKDVGLQTAKKFDADSVSNKKLQELSPHSLRHLSASHQDRAGISMNMIQSNLRHSSLHTTKIYVHSDDLARSEAMEKINLNTCSIHKQTEGHDLELILSLRGTNVCTNQSLKQLLEVTESKILKNVKWRRSELNIDNIVDAYKLASKFGYAHEIRYAINDRLDSNAMHLYKTSISREADIRQFICEVTIN